MREAYREGGVGLIKLKLKRGDLLCTKKKKFSSPFQIGEESPSLKKKKKTAVYLDSHDDMGSLAYCDMGPKKNTVAVQRSNLALLSFFQMMKPAPSDDDESLKLVLHVRRPRQSATGLYKKTGGERRVPIAARVVYFVALRRCLGG